MAYSESNYFNIKVILFVLTLTFLPVYSHALKADSLKAILVEYYHNDTTRVNLLSQIATAYKDVNNDSMRVAALKGLELARKINFEKGKGECLMLVGLASLNAGQNDKAVTTYQEAIACFEKVGNKKAVATATGNIALIYYRTRKTDDAMTWFKKMGDIASAAHDDENYAMSLVRTGYMYSDKGNYSEALSYALRGLSVYERLNDKTNIAACYRDIADVYSLTGDTLRTKEYINKCLATSVGFKDLQARIANYTAVGSIFGRLQDAENALISFNIGYTLADSINNHYWKNVCLINQGEVYMQLRKYEEARSKFTAALKESIIADDSVGMAYNYSGVGGTLLFTGHLREAIEQLLKAYGITSRKGLLHQSFVSASDIGEAYEKLKDYKHALEFMKIARSIKDSMFNEQSDKKIQQLQFEYELGKKQNQIELLNKN
ncbi:MAG: tetratricopeptide repeat protein, partial [Taibaiella sp.]|nr:tetratricopeptide repeat protein [Taibaiella sp.]